MGEGGRTLHAEKSPLQGLLGATGFTFTQVRSKQETQLCHREQGDKEIRSTKTATFKRSMKTDRKCIPEQIPTGCRGRGKRKRIEMFLLPSERQKKPNEKPIQLPIHKQVRRYQSSHEPELQVYNKK